MQRRIKTNLLFSFHNKPIGEGEEITVDAIETYLKANKEKPDVKKFVDGMNAVSNDRVKSYLETDANGKILKKSIYDAEVSTAVEKFKSTHKEKFEKEELPALVELKYKELHPDESEADKSARAMQSQIDELRSENERKDLRNYALQVITEKKLPFTDNNIVDKLLGTDAEKTANNINAFGEIWESNVTAEVDKRLADKGRNNPPAGGADLIENIDKKIEKARKSGNMAEFAMLERKKFEQEQKK
ncbi:MAG: DUF4355 domain-containing protein [PVC group bacterium]|nr:DUF4355 domain-containing protein [PVC group bacterium]